jgi:hypothetical protein
LSKKRSYNPDYATKECRPLSVYNVTMIPNPKTTTDFAFEQYLEQRRIGYSYEKPHNQKGTVPDYLFTKNNLGILVECEELRQLPFDKLPGGSGVVDLGEELKPLRVKIADASKQLKPYADDVDHMVILIGKKEGAAIDFMTLYWAMFGDPVIRVPLNKDPKKRLKAYSDLKVKGSLRRNDPQTKQMVFTRNYIGGIGLIKGFNGLNTYKMRLFDKYVGDTNNNKQDLEKLLSQIMEFGESGWKLYEDEIPRYLLDDPQKILYRVQMVINPFSPKPLPLNIFNGRWDEVKNPTVTQSLALR